MSKDINLFYKMTFECNCFNLSKSESYDYLINLLNNLNHINYDIINYPKLIYIEVKYGDDEIIAFCLNEIKENIANYWLNTQKLIQRLKN